MGEGGSYGLIMASTIFLLLSALDFQLRLTHPTSLLDPVAEPPVTKGYAACGEKEKQDIDNKGKGSSGSLDVSSVDSPGDCPMALLLCLHELVCWIAYQNVGREEQRSATHFFLPEKSAYTSCVIVRFHSSHLLLYSRRVALLPYWWQKCTAPGPSPLPPAGFSSFSSPGSEEEIEHASKHER